MEHRRRNAQNRRFVCTLILRFSHRGSRGGDKNNATFFQNWKICGNTEDVQTQKCPGRINSRGIPQYERSPCMMTTYIVFGLFPKCNIFLQKQQQKTPGNPRGLPVYHKTKKEKEVEPHHGLTCIVPEMCPECNSCLQTRSPPAGMVAAGGRNGAGEREKARPLWNACKYDYTTIAPKVKWDFANVFRRLSKGFRGLYCLYTTDWTRLRRDCIAWCRLCL